MRTNRHANGIQTPTKMSSPNKVVSKKAISKMPSARLKNKLKSLNLKEDGPDAGHRKRPLLYFHPVLLTT